eukprot:4265534-Amphidinium_carterae.1
MLGHFFWGIRGKPRTHEHAMVRVASEVVHPIKRAVVPADRLTSVAMSEGTVRTTSIHDIGQEKLAPK